MPDSSGTKYVLEGRVVTMGPAGVLPDGAIYVDGREIRAVQPADQPAPPDFADAPRIRTGDSIYPGLIELHNHLSYNAMPLWDVPRRYSNNNQWRGIGDYKRLITKPSQTLGRTPGVVEALIRYVEMRCLLGGVTTSQGITLANAGGIQSFYRGIVRNVEQSDDPQLPDAGTSIANPENGGAQAYLQKLQEQTCYLQHLSEGVDDTARGWFLRLQLPNGDWAITDAFCGIHSTALTEDDFCVIAQRGGSMVWSPLSNYLLYGGTINLQAAKASGIRMAIGSDWAPSGSKNLLGELKVGWLASEEHGSVFTPEEIVAMVTRNAAEILKWDHALGMIAPGKRADVICVNGKQGDDFMRLIEARETSITLVVIDGVPRVGQKRLMKRFGPGTETITIGGATRVLNLADDHTHPLVRELTLAEAIARLQDAMQNLPALAAMLDAEAVSGLFSGSTDSTGMTWRIVFEEDEVDEAALLSAEEAVALQPMTLEGITVADDELFLRNLVAARNLPLFVKQGLPALYGEEIPLPHSANFLREIPKDKLPQEVRATTQELKTFLRTWGELTLEDRRTIVEQALFLLEQNYVHLPLKRAMHAVDPVQRLRLLQRRLEDAQPGELPPEIDFHNELASIFNSLRDLHTTYRLPTPFAGVIAWLPFLIEAYWEHDHRKYMISKKVGNVGPDTFQPGVEVLYWNGIPIERTVALNAERHMGSNEAARHARGLNSLTLRPLSHGMAPDEEWVTLRYRTADGEVHEWTQPWLVFAPNPARRGITPETLTAAATALGLDSDTDDVQEAKKLLYAGAVVNAEARMVEEAGPRRPIRNTAEGPSTILPTIFRAEAVTTGRGVFGYLRIFSFSVDDPDAFVDEFVRLVRSLPQEGLIIDVRGNGGGHIHAAERILQVLTPQRIEPERAQFINTATNLQLCRAHARSTRFPGFRLEPWVRSMEQAVATGATYSVGFPITPPEACNDIGQKYFGPVVLITDALCYSATDIFAAGFQDHGIGLVLGVHENTGAGGANVWSHSMLRALSGRDGDYLPLPKGADFRVAVRRTVRVGRHAGDVVEDLGVIPDCTYRMTREDLLHGNRRLIECAADLLVQRKAYVLDVNFVRRNGALQVEAETHNLTRLDVLLNGRPCASLDVYEAVTTVDLSRWAEQAGGDGLMLELHGYDGDVLAAVYRDRVPGA